jgi:hypothetical protein
MSSSPPQTSTVIAPSEHQLDVYYRRINKAGFIGAALVFVLNEVLLRRRLPEYIEGPQGVWSSFVLLVNGQLPAESAQFAVIVVAPIIAFVYVVGYSQLPRWTEQKSGANLRKGLPGGIDEYGRAYFFINSSRELVAFKFWHSVLMRTSLAFCVLAPCMVAGVFRQLS